MLHRLVTAGFVGLVCLAHAGPARAEESSPPADSDASALVRRGVALRKDHRNEEALAEFQKAVAIAPTPLARAQVALAEQALGRWLEAERDLDAALAAAGDDWIAKNRTVLEESRAAVTQHLAWMTVDVDVAAAVVQIDGRAIGAGAEERVIAGAGVLEVLARGYTPDIRRIDVAPGAHARVAIRLVPLVAAPAPAQQPVSAALPPGDAPPSTPSLVGPITLGVLGIGAAGVGTYFGFQTLSDKKARDAVCPGPSCATTGLSHDADARTSATIATVAFAGGAACLVGGIAWYFIDAKNHAPSAARISPVVGPHGVGFAVQGALP